MLQQFIRQSSTMSEFLMDVENIKILFLVLSGAYTFSYWANKLTNKHSMPESSAPSRPEPNYQSFDEQYKAQNGELALCTKQFQQQADENDGICAELLIEGLNKLRPVSQILEGIPLQEQSNQEKEERARVHHQATIEDSIIGAKTIRRSSTYIPFVPIKQQNSFSMQIEQEAEKPNRLLNNRTILEQEGRYFQAYVEEKAEQEGNGKKKKKKIAKRKKIAKDTKNRPERRSCGEKMDEQYNKTTHNSSQAGKEIDGAQINNIIKTIGLNNQNSSVVFPDGKTLVVTQVKTILQWKNPL